MWHVSVHPIGRYHVGLVGARMRCLSTLLGLGDASLGEWEERGEVAYHVKRRLTPEEQAVIGDACDIRNTDEAQQRLTRAWHWLHPSFREYAKQEITL